MKYKVTLNGKIYEVEVEKGNAILLDEYEAAAPAAPVAAPAPQAAVQAAPAAAPTVSAGANAVKSPLPGTVLDVKVSNGQAVKAGELLFIIEAMKMENEVLAPADGTITKVLVSKGSSVETGAALAEMA